MGIIVSCLTGIVTCIGGCIMGIIGAIVDCLECVISAIFGLFTGIADCICDILCCGFIQTPRTRRWITNAFTMDPDLSLLEVKLREQRIAYDFDDGHQHCCVVMVFCYKFVDAFL
ncbi:hypothetical protein F5888DRAFT_512980 [Russula emetica]|nr:hypothetical protein F5888DRAFT_512980 [Russula emetica]